MDAELIRRVGYITGKLSERFPDYQITSRPAHDRNATIFDGWDATQKRVTLDSTLSHEQILRTRDLDVLVDEMAQRARIAHRLDTPDAAP